MVSEVRTHQLKTNAGKRENITTSEGKSKNDRESVLRNRGFEVTRLVSL